VPGESLHISAFNSLREQIGDRGYPERVWREMRGETGIFESSLQHPADILDPHRSAGEGPGSTKCRLEDRRGGCPLEKAGGLEVFVDVSLEVVTDGDFTRLPSFFREPQDHLPIRVTEVTQLELAGGARASGGVDEGREDREITEADQARPVDGAEEFLDLVPGDLGGFALDHGVSRGSGHGRRIHQNDVPLDQEVEVPSNGRNMLFHAGKRSGMLTDVSTDVGRGDRLKCESFPDAPVEELTDRPVVSVAGVRVRKGSVEEVFPGAYRWRPGVLDDGGNRVHRRVSHDIDRSRDDERRGGGDMVFAGCHVEKSSFKRSRIEMVEVFGTTDNEKLGLLPYRPEK